MKICFVKGKLPTFLQTKKNSRPARQMVTNTTPEDLEHDEEPKEVSDMEAGEESNDARPLHPVSHNEDGDYEEEEEEEPPLTAEARQLVLEVSVLPGQHAYTTFSNPVSINGHAYVLCCTYLGNMFVVDAGETDEPELETDPRNPIPASTVNAYKSTYGQNIAYIARQALSIDGRRWFVLDACLRIDFAIVLLAPAAATTAMPLTFAKDLQTSADALSVLRQQVTDQLERACSAANSEFRAIRKQVQDGREMVTSSLNAEIAMLQDQAYHDTKPIIERNLVIRRIKQEELAKAQQRTLLLQMRQYNEARELLVREDSLLREITSLIGRPV